jgi:hypothetical protein
VTAIACRNASSSESREQTVRALRLLAENFPELEFAQPWVTERFRLPSGDDVEEPVRASRVSENFTPSVQPTDRAQPRYRLELLERRGKRVFERP